MNDHDWHHAEETQQQYEEFLRSNYPQWFQHRDKAMPKTSEMIVSKYLRKEDVVEDDIQVTIRGVRQEELENDGKKDQRWVIYFRQFQKGMILNVTSIRVLETAYGDDTDNWTGKNVLLYVDPNVSFGGKVVGGLRMRIPRVKAPQNAVSQPVSDDGFDDKIPF